MIVVIAYRISNNKYQILYANSLDKKLLKMLLVISLTYINGILIIIRIWHMLLDCVHICNCGNRRHCGSHCSDMR